MSPLRAAESAGATPGGAGTLTATASPPSELSGPSNEAAATDDMTVVTLTTDGVEPAAIHGADVQESSSSSGDVVPRDGRVGE